MNWLQRRRLARFLLHLTLLLFRPLHALTQESAVDARARETEQRMTDDERFLLVMSLMPTGKDGGGGNRVPADVPASAGYLPGVPRLGVPALRMTDASLGVTNPGGARPGDTATALPAGLALGATFDPSLARAVGAVVGREARAKGFNVLLGPGMNLVRDPRNGRNFEYISEDPLLTGVTAGEAIIGTQAESVVSTVKHFSLNADETNRNWFDAIIDPVAHRESDLLAFQMAIERGQPGSVMCAYNKVNGVYACGNDTLLNDELKGRMGFRGWVMSDWGAVHDWRYALDGLDQESGVQMDRIRNGKAFFDAPLRRALADGQLPHARLSDMVRRVLRSIYAVGLDRARRAPTVDMARDNATALEVAREGSVLLRNEGGALPLSAGVRRIAVIGGHAQVGVPTGGGSSEVTPPSGFAFVDPIGGNYSVPENRAQAFLPSSPVQELRRLLPDASISYDPGAFPADAVALARQSDIAIVVVVRHESEGFDSPDLSLPYGQDALIEAVAAANPNTVVVLETGNPIAMPWRERVRAIVEAWFPGQAGGQAIAEVLTGRVNPSGRLPITFPADVAQTPRPALPGFGTSPGTAVSARYEGAEVGYRWFAHTGAKPLYAFGYGLSYTRFAYADLDVSGGETVTVRFTVTNTGPREGADVPQFYLTDAGGDRRMRLLGFERIVLRAGESRRVTVTTADPRLLARFDDGAGQWRIAGGAYQVMVGSAADAPVLAGEADLQPRLFGR